LRRCSRSVMGWWWPGAAGGRRRHRVAAILRVLPCRLMMMLMLVVRLMRRRGCWLVVARGGRWPSTSGCRARTLQRTNVSSICLLAPSWNFCPEAAGKYRDMGTNLGLCESVCAGERKRRGLSVFSSTTAWVASARAALGREEESQARY
jgi:hypothetical protein